MEVQIFPALHFNGSSNQNMIHPSAQPKSYDEPTSKRFKSDLTFQCIACDVVYDDPNVLYEHMKLKHQELYERENESGDENYCSDSESEHELSDEDYLDLSRLLEPICELKQEDDDIDDQSSNMIAQLMQNNPFALPMNEEQLRVQLQLQIQLQNHLLQMQSNVEAKQKQPKRNGHAKSNHDDVENPLSLRKLKMKEHSN